MMQARGEFALIRDYLTGLGAPRADVRIDIGDDCALTEVPAGYELALSIDTLVAGVHFFVDCDPKSLGHKALAVGLSDLAAVGAQPAWATLALTLPHPDSQWLHAFSQGFSQLAGEHGMRLIGGDLTRGPLSFSVQVMGFVPQGQGLLRAGASPDEHIFVSGHLGDAGLALRQFLQVTGSDHKSVDPGLRARLECPSPRVRLGQALRGVASAAIDLSDGLAADLGHLLEQSQIGAEISLPRLPLSPLVAAEVAVMDDWTLPLCSGDDYELCFTVAAQHLPALQCLTQQLDCPITQIGRTTSKQELRFFDAQNRAWPSDSRSASIGGFNHFAPDKASEFPRCNS